MYTNRCVHLVIYISIIEILYFPQGYSLKNKDKPCHQYDTCKCIFPTGRGINLEAIGETMSTDIKNNYKILLHLCGDVMMPMNLTNNYCNQSVSVCYVDESKGLGYNLGKVEDSTIVSTSEFQPISVLYSSTHNATNVRLVCDEEAIVPKLTMTSFTSEGYVYNLELRSQHACVRILSAEELPDGGLSTGSVLVIMLLVLTLLYFGGGMLALRFLRGAEGKEMIPNIDFWRDLPYLVRDGVLFTLNGFSPPASYDRI